MTTTLNPSKAAYFRSLALELDAQSQRVRQLIGSAHWGHDGRHKEVLLAEMLRRHCPATVLVSTGFVVSPNNLEIRSLEQDILVVDVSSEAPLFHQGSLVVAFAHTIMAAISVKSLMDPASLRDTVDGLQTVREVARDAGLRSEKLWCAGFFYDIADHWAKQPLLVYRHLKRCITAKPATPPIILDDCACMLGPNFIGDSSQLALIIDYENKNGANLAKARGYSCGGVATAVFLSCLLEHIAISFGAGHAPFTDLLAEVGIPPVVPPTFDIVAL